MFAAVLENNLAPGSGLRKGTTITGSSTANVKGAWTELIASTGADAEGIWVAISGVVVSATDTRLLLDIGTGAVAAEVVVVPNIVGGNAAQNVGRGQSYFFVVAIPSGSRVSARLQGAITSETAEVVVWLEESIQHLDGASAVEAVGASTADSGGVSVTAGANAFGPWTNMGTIGADRNLFMPALDGDGSTNMPFLSGDMLVEMGHGTNAPDAGGTAIDATYSVSAAGAEDIFGITPPHPVFADLASGETLWARLATDSAAQVRGIVIHAMEGAAVAGGGGGGIKLAGAGGGLIG